MKERNRYLIIGFIACVLFLLVFRACIMSYSHRASVSHITCHIEPIIDVVLYFTMYGLIHDTAALHACRVRLYAMAVCYGCML